AVVENELQRCVRARQLLRERDSFLAEQDQLMNQQNDLLLSMQNLQQDSEAAMASDEDDTSGSDEYKSMQMQRVSEKIEIIDAELHHLDLKVRDAEAEVAQLAEAAPETDDASNLNASGLLAAPTIINMSGLAMRMVEDVVRVDYRAFADMFQNLPQADSTGLAYLLMQDIIEHRLVALRDARERTSLEDQAMDLRRTLLAMQKTALNAALSYERELGDAERKLDLLLPPLLSSAAHQPLRRGSAVQTAGDVSDGPSSDKSGEGATSTVLASDAAVPERSIYEGVRERGILLRSALISAMEALPLGSEASASTSRIGRADGLDEGASSGDNMSMENIRGAKAHVAEWSEDASDFASVSDGIGGNDDNNSVSDNASLLPYDSIHSKLSPVDPTRVNPFSEHRTAHASSRPSSPDAAPVSFAALGDLAHVNSSSEDTTRMFADASDIFDPMTESGMAAWSASRVALAPGSRLNMASSPVESDASYVGEPRGLGAQQQPSPPPPTSATTQTVTVIDTLPVDSDNGGEYLTGSEASGIEERDLPELYHSGSGGNHQLPNLARNQSVRSRHRRSHLARQTSMRKRISYFKLAGSRPAHSGSINRRRGSLRKARISLPIVPPEMIEYVNKRNPTAISVGGAPPLIASPEMLREMRIVPDGDYQGNIAAFASFAVKQHTAALPGRKSGPPLPPRRESIPNSPSERPLADMGTSVFQATSPADSCQTQVGSASPNASPQVYIPRSAGKLLSQVDVGSRSPSSHSPHARLGAPVSPTTSMLWSPVTVGGAPSLLESLDNTLLPTAHSTPQQHSPASVDHSRPGSSPNAQHASQKSVASAVSSSVHSKDVLPSAKQDATAFCGSPTRSSGPHRARADSRSEYTVLEQPCTSPNRLRREISRALVQPSPGQAMLGDYAGSRRPYSDIPDASTMTRPAFAVATPRPHSDVGANAAVSEVERPQRFMSPTEFANASMLSMLGAAHTEISNGENSMSDNEGGESRNSQVAFKAAGESKSSLSKDLAADKPARIRRRAQTTHAGGDAGRKPNDGRAISRLSTHSGMEKPAGSNGGSRLSKILGGFGLGGSKSKPPPQPSFILHDYYKAGPSLDGYGGMVSTTDFGRDRSNSDSTESRVARIRKVHSTHYDWPVRAMPEGGDRSRAMPVSQQGSAFTRPSTANVDKAVTPAPHY
ncbi:hypothetical protein GGI00_001418, partial [Coemansia sp. RSA 2681]